LTFTGGLGGSSTLSGSITGGNLTLTVPQTSGQLVTETYAPSDSGSYNTAVAQLQDQANQAQAQATAAAQAAASLAQQWTSTNWQNDTERAAVASSSACVLTVTGHDVRVFVASGGTSICGSAGSVGWSSATDYLDTNYVTCVVSDGGVTVAVTDDGGQYYGGIACSDLKAGTFPSKSVS
jgi:hypothetical protein